MMHFDGWHALEPEEALRRLESSEAGLDEEEVRRRLERFGPNRLPEPRARPAWRRFLAQFENVLIQVLMGAAVVTLLLGHLVDGLVILAVVVINAFIGFVQEGRAEDAIEAIRAMLSPTATVIRHGHQRRLPAEELVPGDVVLLQAGDRVPADLRLLRVKGLKAQEAALTGESMAVEKSVEPVAPEAVVGDRRSMLFSGTLVTYGQGVGVVVATGGATEIGRISEMVSAVEETTTPLLRQMAAFGRVLTVVILALAALTFLVGVAMEGYGWSEMFMASVSLAVAAIPEGLPAIMTITLAIGVQRMARRNAIIRRLPAVETLGAVSVICTDKTGTLTLNEMTVRSVVTAGGELAFEGTGYDPHGIVTREGGEVWQAEEESPETWLLRAAALCNDAAVIQEQGQWQVVGDPMEGALVVAARKAGLEAQALVRQFPRTDLIPFDSDYRFMATLHHSHAGRAFIFIKGAPEKIVAMSVAQLGSNGATGPIDHRFWHQRMEALAGEGQRLLAFAFKEVAFDHMELTFGDLDDGVVMLGLAGLIDPPRPEAVEAVATCRGAGIEVKMITGDHAATARAIGRQIGLARTEEVLTGEALDALDDDTLRPRVVEVDVYARVDPAHKLRLVRLLQDHGRVVAMTGDGVNDAPALKQADVGTAMGRGGTEAAKEAADMVLADDNFASIAHAVEEGRTVYDNLRKAILFILPTNGGQALTIMGAIALGLSQLPLTPVQILWVNMVTAVTLALSLAFEPPERGLMKRPPRDPDAPLLDRFLLWRIAFVSTLLMAATFALFQWQMALGRPVEEARTVAVNALVICEIFYLFNSRYITASVLSREGVLGNHWVVGAALALVLLQLAFTYLEPMQFLFGTAPIDLQAWLVVVTVASALFWLVELEKAWMRRREAGGARK